MWHMPRMRSCPAPLLLLWATLSLAAAATSPLALPPSALLTVTGSASAQGVTLQVRPTHANAPLSVSAVSLAVDGLSATASRQPDGSWYASRPAQTGKTAAPVDGKLDVFVTHDGIREVISGTLPASAAATTEAGAALRNHKQMLWWVLNIAIVMVAAIAISRRTS
jgi:hypothetical protein